MIEIGDPNYTFFTWDGNTAAETPAAGYTISYDQPQIQETTAVLSAKVDNPARYQVAQVGCYLWDANDTLLTRHVEDCQRPESRFNMWYDVQGELGIALTPGTTYKYQFFVMQDGLEYPGNVESFTTAGTALRQETPLLRNIWRESLSPQKRRTVSLFRMTKRCAASEKSGRSLAGISPRRWKPWEPLTWWK